MVVGLLCVLLPSAASAQTDPSPFVSFGARGGLLWTSWDYSEGEEFFERGRDFMAGGFVAIGGRSDRPFALGVVADVLFARQRVGDVFIGEDVVRTVVQVPILLKVNAIGLPFANSRLYGVAGPAVDVQTKAEFGEEDVTDLYEDALLSIIAGAGVEAGKWSVEVRAAWGTSSVVRDLLGPGEIKPVSIAVLGGFRIR
jgi:hypothetical protein